MYEPAPAYQQGVQSTGYRTTPDVSLVADPATGAWIADPYNVDPSNPLEVVGGTSLSAPAWAGLVAIANQGRSAAGESTLNSSTPTDTQQALYMLPQSEFSVISSGNNGYSAEAGYNLVTGLGTRVANLLVPDLIAYQGPGTSYAGPTVGALQSAGLVNTGTSDGGLMDVFSVFDSLTILSGGLDDGRTQAFGTDISSLTNVTLAPDGAGRSTAGITSGSTTSQNVVGAMPLAPAGATITVASIRLALTQTVWSTARPIVNASAAYERSVVLGRTDHGLARPLLTRPRTCMVPDSVLDELTCDAVIVRESMAAVSIDVQVVRRHDVTGEPALFETVRRGADLLQPASEIHVGETTERQSDSAGQSPGFAARLAVILLAAGSCGYGANRVTLRDQRVERSNPKRTFSTIMPRLG